MRIASGKLPLGVPVNFYVQLSKIRIHKKAKFTLDTINSCSSAYR